MTVAGGGDELAFVVKVCEIGNVVKVVCVGAD